MWTDMGSMKKKYISPKKKKGDIKKIFKEWETDPLRERMFEEVAKVNDQFCHNQKYNITETFKEYIKYRIRRKANLLVGIEAPPGEGKSMVGLWVDTLWIQFMKEERKQEVGLEFAFDSAQTRNKIAAVKDGWIIHKDEDTTMEGTGKSTAEAEETNFAETMRFTSKSLVTCAPHISLLSGMTLLLRPMAILSTDDRSKFQTRVLVYQLQEDQPGRTPKFVLLGHLIAGINEIDPNLISKYEKAKAANFRKIEKMGGAVGAMGKEDLKQLKTWAKKIFKLAEKDGWPDNPDQPSKKALTKYIYQLNLALTGKKEDIIKDYVIQEYRQSNRKSKPSTPAAADVAQIPQPSSATKGDEFMIDDTKILENMLKNASEKDKSGLEREIEIYLGSKDPLKSAKIYADKYGISEVRVGQLKRSLIGKLADARGHVYEEFLLPFLQQKFVKVTHLGGTGQPDFICENDKGEIIFYSVKCYDISRSSYSLSYTEADAEIKEARIIFSDTGKLPKIIQHLYELNSKKIWEFEIESVLIEKIVPYTQRNHQIIADKFTRDPNVAGWV